MNTLERRTGRQMDSAMLEVTGRSKSVDQVRSQREVDRRGESYVPRGQKFNHLLDTAYQEILVKKTKDTSRGQSRASHALYESFRPMDLMSGTGMKIFSLFADHFWKKFSLFFFLISVSDDDIDEEALERKLAMERLHAEERGRANQLILQKIDIPDEDTVPDSAPISRNESTGEPSEAKVEAFLDEIEGETLGQMLSYLSSELESTDDPEQAEQSADRNKRRTEQIDHVFAEITKVTQAAVDRYVDGILLNTIYKKAGQKAGVAMEEKVRKLRRSSTSDLGENLYTSSMDTIMERDTDNLKIKRRIKDFQKKHLLAAHEALWGVLGEMKEKGEVCKSFFQILTYLILFSCDQLSFTYYLTSNNTISF